MKVFKFGGASVNSVERIKFIPTILEKYREEKLVIIISAMGKTTNALEQVVGAFMENDTQKALSLFEVIKTQHLDTARSVLVQSFPACEAQLNDFFTEAEWLLHDKPVREYDYYYDQLVCLGELLSTTIISHFLQAAGMKNQWLDVRDIIRTDDNFRDAIIDWEVTGKNMLEKVEPVFKKENWILTQGFIGATDENESTTLGREGSDYTAAVFANMLNATDQTIWKDVISVMNADPKKFSDARSISELNYKEVIEMAYYGAQVIHPKTIKPLQNKSIPMYVKCFLDPSLPGTVIHNSNVKELPPIVVLKENQVMMDLQTLDYSFTGDHHLEELYHFFDELKLKPNLIQTGAINTICVLDDHPEKIQSLALRASSIFSVNIEKGLSLLTIRHYTGEYFGKLTADRTILLKQQTPETVQALMR